MRLGVHDRHQDDGRLVGPEQLLEHPAVLEVLQVLVVLEAQGVKDLQGRERTGPRRLFGEVGVEDARVQRVAEGVHERDDGGLLADVGRHDQDGVEPIYSYISLSLYIYIYIHISLSIYIYIYMYNTYIYIYIYIYTLVEPGDAVALLQAPERVVVLGLDHSNNSNNNKK